MVNAVRCEQQVYRIRTWRCGRDRKRQRSQPSTCRQSIRMKASVGALNCAAYPRIRPMKIERLGAWQTIITRLFVKRVTVTSFYCCR